MKRAFLTSFSLRCKQTVNCMYVLLNYLIKKTKFLNDFTIPSRSFESCLLSEALLQQTNILLLYLKIAFSSSECKELFSSSLSSSFSVSTLGFCFLWIDFIFFSWCIGDVSALLDKTNVGECTVTGERMYSLHAFLGLVIGRTDQRAQLSYHYCTSDCFDLHQILQYIHGENSDPLQQLLH